MDFTIAKLKQNGGMHKYSLTYFNAYLFVNIRFAVFYKITDSLVAGTV